MIMSLALRFVDGPDEAAGEEEGDEGKEGEDIFSLEDSISILLMNYDVIY
jgi:hypothetical protein